MRRKALNLPLANAGESEAIKKLKRDNELLIRDLRRMQAGPFKVWNWFKK